MRLLARLLSCVLPLVLAVGVGACNVSGPEHAEEEPSAGNRYVHGDLSARIEAIQTSLPRRGSEGFVRPSGEDLEHWRTLVNRLIDTDTLAADSIVAEQLPSYGVVRFTDVNTEQTFLVLQEISSVERGWGLIVVNPTPERNLAIEVPHPVYDLDTHRQGVDAFVGTGARVLIMAGTHRCANEDLSSCDGTSGVCEDGNYPVSDMAHFTAAPFQAAHEVFAKQFPEMVAVSLHGNGREACEDVFLSNGLTDTTHASLRKVEAALAERGVRVGRPSTSSCPLVGRTNVQGRFTNGSSQPCTEPASATNGTFLHIEQRRAFRGSPEAYGALIEALNTVFE